MPPKSWAAPGSSRAAGPAASARAERAARSHAGGAATLAALRLRTSPPGPPHPGLLLQLGPGEVLPELLDVVQDNQLLPLPVREQLLGQPGHHVEGRVQVANVEPGRVRTGTGKHGTGRGLRSSCVDCEVQKRFSAKLSFARARSVSREKRGAALSGGRRKPPSHPATALGVRVSLGGAARRPEGAAGVVVAHDLCGFNNHINNIDKLITQIVCTNNTTDVNNQHQTII